MKKTLLLSVVASGFLFAGGDIAPVEPAVVTPAPAPVAAATGWKFSGQGVVYYQTDDSAVSSRGLGFGGVNNGNLFDQESSAANAGLQLTATNDDLIAGIGFGAQLNGLGTLGLEEYLVSDVMQVATTPTVSGPNLDPSNLNGAYFSQLYLTYGIDNTSFKVGRQELPKALSPFAYSEDWNVFKNTYNAALVVNTDIQDTVLVGAWVRSANMNGMHASMNDFNSINGNDGVWMLTAQNKSIADLTLTGSYYYMSGVDTSFAGLTAGVLTDSVQVLWADAQYNAGFANIGLQGGTVMLDTAGLKDTNAFGAKISGKLDIVNASLAYSHVNASTAGMFNVGGSTSVLYTDTVLDQVNGMNENNSDKYVLSANADVLGGNLAGAYAYTNDKNVLSDNTNEFDLVYSTNITDSISAALAYVYVSDDDINPLDNINVIRAVAKYNF